MLVTVPHLTAIQALLGGTVVIASIDGVALVSCAMNIEIVYTRVRPSARHPCEPCTYVVTYYLLYILVMVGASACILFH